MKVFKYSSLTLIILSLIGAVMSCSSFGNKPSGKHLDAISKSINYDPLEKKFMNPGMDLSKEKQSFWEITKAYINGKEKRAPKSKMPEEKPDLAKFLSPSLELKFVWLGHSTFMVNMNQKIILFDPVFSNSISPIKVFGSRFQAPALTLQELPPIDYIVISHDHYDHLDMNSIKYFKDKNTRFLIPLGVGSYLIGWGIEKERITELDWWDEKLIAEDGLEFICTPSQHFSGRLGAFTNPTLWASWVVRSKDNSVYFSGDSGYGKHFKEIGEKYGPFNLTFMENGQYSKYWKKVHMMPEESAQAHLDLKGAKMVPVHWGMFNLSLHNWFDPIEEALVEAKIKGNILLTPKLGELVLDNNSKTNETIKWWKLDRIKKVGDIQNGDR
jgi:L-ascorbate metabolism protein UlaG (beta-lactamase superfamily)